LRYRASLVEQRTGIKNSIHALLSKSNVSPPFRDLFCPSGMRFLSSLELAEERRFALSGKLRILDALSQEIKLVEGVLKETYRESEEALLLSTLPGVGMILSLTILSEIGEVGRFHSAKHLSSFAGLVPSTHQSGGHQRHGRITKQGSRWLRWALVEAAIHAAGKPGPLRDHYLKVKKKKGAKVARVATARKMATYIYHMLKEKKTYQELLLSISRPSDLG